MIPPSFSIKSTDSSFTFQIEPEPATGPQHTVDLGQRSIAVEPVKGLTDRDRVDRGHPEAGSSRRFRRVPAPPAATWSAPRASPPPARLRRRRYRSARGDASASRCRRRDPEPACRPRSRARPRAARSPRQDRVACRSRTAWAHARSPAPPRGLFLLARSLGRQASVPSRQRQAGEDLANDAIRCERRDVGGADRCRDHLDDIGAHELDARGDLTAGPAHAPRHVLDARIRRQS